MVFDFNAWNLKWRDCKPEDPMINVYWDKLQEVKKDFREDRLMFNEAYDNPNHIIKINYDFLTENLDEILEKNLYLPSDFRCHLYELYPHYKEKLDENANNQFGSVRNSSVLASGLKPMMANVHTKEEEKKLLLFEVMEFALTYPEYEDVLIEYFLE